MSILPPEIHSALDQLLQGLSASDNTIRQRAEEQLNTDWVAAQPDVLLMGLVEQLQQAIDPSVRDMSRASATCVLLTVWDIPRLDHLRQSYSGA